MLFAAIRNFMRDQDDNLCGQGISSAASGTALFQLLEFVTVVAMMRGMLEEAGCNECDGLLRTVTEMALENPSSAQGFIVRMADADTIAALPNHIEADAVLLETIQEGLKKAAAKIEEENDDNI